MAKKSNGKVLLHLTKAVPEFTELPTDLGEKWRDGFQVNAERINAKRIKKIPDEIRYQSQVVGASTKVFKTVFDPNFVSRKGLKTRDIINKHAKNLGRSYEKYRSKLDKAYATVDGIPAKRFKESVEHAKEIYARGMLARTLPFTGTRVDGLGVAPLVALWLTADNVAGGLLSGDETVKGMPILITKVALKGSFKAAINQRLIQAGATIVASIYEPAIIKEENDTTNEMVDGYADKSLNLEPFETSGKSHIDYIYKKEQAGLYLEVKVTKK